MGFITGSDSSLLYRELHGLPWKWILPAAFVAWRIWIVVYRLWFHPLAHIPGPRLAAVSHMYMAYWQVYRDGLFYRQRPELFKKYGKC